MERYNKYFVLKTEDIGKYLSDDQQLTLSALSTKIEVHRLHAGKKPQKYVCVAADWPMYEDVWKMVEAFVDGKPSELESLRAQNAVLRDALEAVDKQCIQGCVFTMQMRPAGWWVYKVTQALAATKEESLQALSELSERLGGYEPKE